MRSFLFSKFHSFVRFSGGALLLILIGLPAQAADPLSLKTVPAPQPENLSRYVADEAAAVRLGKALFWDLQVGSDGMTACASCHFHAGTDNRTRNTASHGPDGRFDAVRVNGTLTREDFPFRQFSDPHDRFSALLRNFDDVVGAQGVPLTLLRVSRPGQAAEAGRSLHDRTFQRNARNVNQVTGRNAPSVINAVFNYANFLDGRANHFFNGVNPFGVQDDNARIWINNGGVLAEFNLNEPENLLNNSALASQAIGPLLNEVEMSWRGRSFPDLARKLYSLPPLGLQEVHPRDSVLGPLAKSRNDSGAKGLNTTYPELIHAAFHPEFWNGADTVAGHTQMEKNFPFFFGLAVQLYEATLVSDDSPFDRFLDGDPLALTVRQQEGLNLFFSDGLACTDCHVGPELTAASISNAKNPQEPGLVETMNMADGTLATYDIGFYNIGVTPTGDDPGRGGEDPFGNPLSFSRQRTVLAGSARANTSDGQLTFNPVFVPDPGCVPDLLAEPPLICPPDMAGVTRVAAYGAFKTPNLRNVELTGPYFHNGGAVTLMQVVDFYIRGGNFREANLADLDPAIHDIDGLKGADMEGARRALVDFLLSLTDERVRWEMAPFDHPQLFVSDGHHNGIDGNPKRTRVLARQLRELPAIGAAGRPAQGLPPLKPFLAEDREGTALTNFHYQP